MLGVDQGQGHGGTDYGLVLRMSLCFLNCGKEKI